MDIRRPLLVATCVTALALGLGTVPMVPVWAAPAAQGSGAADKSVASLIAAMTQAAAVGNRAEVQALADQISQQRETLPAWAAEKQAAASQIAPEKEKVAALWNRYRQAALTAVNGGNLQKALQTANQALTLARDNFGDSHLTTLSSTSDLAQINSIAGSLDAAETLYRDAYPKAAQTLGAGHPETLRLLGNLADLYAVQGQFAKAVDTQTMRVIAARKSLGGDHGLTLDALQAQARDMDSGGQFVEAERLLKATCDQRRKAYGDAHPKTGQCLAQHAATLLQLGELDMAADLTTQALTIQKSWLDNANPASLPLRMDAAAIALKQGKAGDAQTLLEAVLTDAQAAKDPAMVIEAKASLAIALDETGDYSRAEQLADEVVAERLKTLGADHPNTLAARTTLASIYRKQGRLAEAEVLYRDCFDRYTATMGTDHKAVIIAAANLGEILEKQGLFDQAEPLLRTSVQISRKTLGDTNPTTLIGMNNLALLLESQGDFEKAESLYQTIITAYGKKRGPNHPDTIAFVNNLAYLHMLKGSYDKAAPLFKQVISTWTAAYGANHQNTLKARNSLARVYHRLGKTAEAEAAFKDVLAARRKVLGDKHLDVFRTQIDLGNLYVDSKRPKDAAALLTQAVQSTKSVLGALHPYSFEAMNALAAAQEALGDRSGALQTRHAAFDNRNDFYNRMLYVTGDNAREGYVRLHQPEYAAYLALLSQAERTTAGRGVLEASLNRKGLLFKVASELQQTSRLSKSPELRDISQDLTAARKRLAALTLSGPTEETRDNHLELISELEDRIDKLQGDLGRASARFQKSIDRIRLDDLATAMPDDSVLVDFLQYSVNGKSHLVAGILRKDGSTPVYEYVAYDDPAKVDAAIQKYRQDIQNEEADLDEVLESGQRTFDIIWKPLEAALGNKKTVFVIPDGMLNILPFTALVEKNGKYLVERLDLHIYTTSRNLLPSKLPAATGGYMINAGPDYNTDDVVGKETLDKARSRGGSVSEGLRGMSSGMRGLKFDPLPGAEKEGQLIRQKVDQQGKPNVIYSKRDAQERTLRDMEQPPEILHIATHGFFLKPDDTLRKRLLKLQRGGDVQLPPPGDNPLLRSGLAFAGINANAQLLGEIDTDNDGVLTALEVLGLDLTGAKLAILSACETGLGEIHEGEGVYGLRRSFQEAGAGSVISSLWEVSDAGTQTLMTSLYGRLLTGTPPHQALREAQLEMLRIGKWSSPYIWSAFFMVDG